ncbi:uncharacterized protein LOC135202055 [Macrobrachium nipponense]|uniref:uncharacterized protein LOC135202055 n=1 Tax=Macrobrachium nipponense TaxID=159736 RepID=UPI0030C7C04B
MGNFDKSNPMASFRLIILCLLIKHAASQCSQTETFEKVSRTTVDGVSGSSLYSSNGNTVTLNCLQRCRESKNCLSFVVNYDRDSCTSYDRDSSSADIKLRPTQLPINYFEKICIDAPQCGKNWMLERVVGFEIEGYDDIVLNNVPSRLKCAELCIRERGLMCRSAEYHQRDGVCRLSRQDRRTQPLSFRPASPLIHYIENQCSGVANNQHCDFEEFPAQDLGHGDLQVPVESKTECHDACESEKSFNCRAYTWFSRGGVCRLSGDDLTSTGLSAVKPLPDASFYQRAPCLDLELSCSVDGMSVSLNTIEPFKGRLFARDFPNECKSLDKGKTDTSLFIKFDDPQCGVMNEGEGIYSNVIVVQHHPVIQRRGDKAIKLLCLFETSNKTISDSYNFIVDNSVNAGVATAIVNATAPSPRIRLRIVDRTGKDINGARLGEELYLRLDLDDDSVYGILARNLVAKSGDNSDSITLLDERGCPADPVIFPSLQPVPNSKSLQGKFEAFKFSENQVVRFQVNVQFCLQECKPAQCGNILSHGKRKRRAVIKQGGLVTLGGTHSLDGQEITLEGGEFTFGGGELTFGVEDDEDAEEYDQDSIYHEMPLQKEIFVDSTSVKPLKSGLLPEESEARRLAHMVCTSREILIAILVSAVILQICIILIAIMCVLARSRKQPKEENHYATYTIPRRTLSPYPPTTSEDSATTLKTLRTTLRD